MAATRLIVFSHANGFPAGTYRVLFEAWRAAGFRVEALDRIGHDPAYPVTSNWPHLIEQLLHFAERAGAPACFVGHSLGGFLSLLAACRRPELAAGVVMLDSPVVAGWRAHGLRVVKATGLMRRLSPAHVSQRRRYEWPSPEAARAHFASKPAFARWDARVLDDYIAAGIHACGGLARLSFDRATETRIYETLPHHLPTVLRRHPPRCPVAFIAGTQSAEVRRAGLAATRAVVGDALDWVEGTHLYPMERPDATATAVLRRLELFGEPACAATSVAAVAARA